MALTLPALEAQAATPLCWGQVPIIVGTEGNDSLAGRDDVKDVIYAAGGDDYIWLGSANQGDLVCGGPGNDYIIAGAGPDKVNGGDGNDEVDGGRGSDTVQGNAGDDVIWSNGEEGEDYDSWDSGNDVLRGGIGHDTIYLGHGTDKAYGEGGNDWLFDFDCTISYLYGGAGNDTFHSQYWEWDGSLCSTTKDTISGATGTDQAWVNRSDYVTGVEKLSRL